MTRTVHFASEWTQEDFGGMTAYFAKTAFGQDMGMGLALSDRAKPLKYSFDGLQGELKPRFLDGSTPGTDAWRACFSSCC